MNKQTIKQEKLDLLYKDQMRLDIQLEDNQDEQKRFISCEKILSILKEMLFISSMIYS